MSAPRFDRARVAAAVFTAACSVAALTYADVIDNTWLGGAGSWNDPTRWSAGVVPNNSGTTMFRAFIPSGTPVIPAQVFSVDSVSVAGGATLTSNSPSFAVGSDLRVDGNVLINTGNVLIDGAGAATGTGTVTVGNTSGFGGASLRSASTLTIGSNLTVNVNHFNTLVAQSGALINRGHIYSGWFDWSWAARISGASFTNEGTIEARSGAVRLNGAFTRADLGNLVWTGADSAFVIAGTLLNDGQTLHCDSTHRWGLIGGTLRGGTLNVAAGSAFRVGDDYTNGATFDDVLVIGRVDLFGRRLTLTNGNIIGTADYHVGSVPGVPGVLATSSPVLTIGPSASVHVLHDGGGSLGDGLSKIVNNGTISTAPFGGSLIVYSSEDIVSAGTIALMGRGTIEIGMTSAPRNLLIAAGGTLRAEFSESVGTGELWVSGALDLQSSDDQLILSIEWVPDPYEFRRIARAMGGIIAEFDSVSPDFQVQYRNGTEIWARYVPEPTSAVALAAVTGWRVRRRSRVR